MTNGRTTTVPAPGHTGLYYYEERLNKLEPATAYPRTEATEVLLALAKSHYECDPARVAAATAVLEHGPLDTTPALVFPVGKDRGAARVPAHVAHPESEPCPTADLELQEAAGLYYMLGGLPSALQERPAGWFWRRAAKMLAGFAGWSYDGSKWVAPEKKEAEKPPIVVYVVTIEDSQTKTRGGVVDVASTLERAKEAASAWARGQKHSGVLDWKKDGAHWFADWMPGDGGLVITASPVARPGGP